MLQFKAAAKLGDVTLRRSAEMFFVVAAKVRWVFIAYAEPGARRVQVFAEHQAARFLEPDLFLKLQGAHRRDGLEVVMEAGNAHSEFVRDVIHSHRLVKVFAQQADRFGNAVCVCA